LFSSQKKRCALGKWEYCVIGPIKWNSNMERPELTYLTHDGRRSVEMAPIPGRMLEADVLAQHIAQMGEDGWELVGCGNVSEQRHILYFKRAKTPVVK
jgi:hypothetical protein